MSRRARCSVLCMQSFLSFSISNFYQFSLKMCNSLWAQWYRNISRLGKTDFKEFHGSTWGSARTHTHTESLLKSTVALKRAAGSYRGAIKTNTHTQRFPADWLVSRKGQVAPDHWPRLLNKSQERSHVRSLLSSWTEEQKLQATGWRQSGTQNQYNWSSTSVICLRSQRASACPSARCNSLHVQRPLCLPGKPRSALSLAFPSNLPSLFQFSPISSRGWTEHVEKVPRVKQKKC